MTGLTFLSAVTVALTTSAVALDKRARTHIAHLGQLSPKLVTALLELLGGVCRVRGRGEITYNDQKVLDKCERVR
jgi:hypothetical protein